MVLAVLPSEREKVGPHDGDSGGSDGGGGPGATTAACTTDAFACTPRVSFDDELDQDGKVDHDGNDIDGNPIANGRRDFEATFEGTFGSGDGSSARTETSAC